MDGNVKTIRISEMGSAALEVGVLPLLEAMNGLVGVQTFASCQGHPERDPSLMLEHPYVAFRARRAVAKELGLALQGLHSRSPKLHFCWRIYSFGRAAPLLGWPKYMLCFDAAWHQSIAGRKRIHRKSARVLREACDADMLRIADTLSGHSERTGSG